MIYLLGNKIIERIALDMYEDKQFVYNTRTNIKGGFVHKKKIIGNKY